MLAPRSIPGQRLVAVVCIRASVVLLLLCGLTGCDGCDSGSSSQKKGAREKTSMAGQPEEYLDATRLDAKSDSTALASDESGISKERGQLDSFEIVLDSTDEYATDSLIGKFIKDRIDSTLGRKRDTSKVSADPE